MGTAKPICNLVTDLPFIINYMYNFHNEKIIFLSWKDLVILLELAQFDLFELLGLDI